ncbi:MAG: hypothetical protein ACE5J3_13265, partial [Methanosarcinales archaeon]
HKIFDYRIKIQFLLKRAFWQGYSKKAMKKLVRDSMYEERGFLKNLVFKSVPELLKKRELQKLIYSNRKWIFVRFRTNRKIMEPYLQIVLV